MLQGSSPIRLQQLDISPALEAGALEQQAAVNLASSIQQAALNFAQKQEEKKQEQIGIRSIQSLLGTDEATSKAIYKDPTVRAAYADAQNLAFKEREMNLKELQAFAEMQPEPQDPAFEPRTFTLNGQTVYELEPSKFDFAPEPKDPSAKELEFNQIKDARPDLSDDVVNDIVYDRLDEVQDPVSGNFVGYRSKTTGKIINYNPETNEITEVPQSQESQVGYGTVLKLDSGNIEPETKVENTATKAEDPIVAAPTLDNQGIYGQLVLLDEAGNAPTGVEQSVVGGLDNLFSSFFGGSPIKLDQDIRMFKNRMDVEFNQIANAIRTNPTYSVKEYNNLESYVSAIKDGTFNSAKQMRTAMEALNQRFDREIERISNILTTQNLDKTTRLSYQKMLNDIQRGKDVLGVDRYKKAKDEGVSNLDAILEELNKPIE
jgi:hypothetical protein